MRLSRMWGVWIVVVLLLAGQAIGASAIGAPLNLLICFGRDGCEPCQKMKPVIAALRADGYAVVDVNISRSAKSRGIARQWDVELFPTSIVITEGKVACRVIGSTTKAKLVRHLKKPHAPNKAPRPTKKTLPRTLKTAFASITRIVLPDGSCGTGVAIADDGRQIWVLTNAHVVDDASKAQTYWWRDGHQAAYAIDATVVAARQSCDAAILTVDKRLFGGYSPPIIPLADSSERLSPGQNIVSVGCPKGGWPTAFSGHVLGYEDGGERVAFRPAPADGRSGSPLLTADGSRVLGLVHARVEKGNYGLAITRTALENDMGLRYSPTACSVARCPGRACGPVLPYRRRQEEQRTPRSSTPFPMLPSPAPSPSVDLDGIEDRLDQIAVLIQSQEQTPQPSATNETNPILMILVIGGAVAIGFVVYFASQKE